MTDPDPAQEVRRAVREVRREVLKAALLTAAVEGVLVALAVNAALAVLPFAPLGRSLAGPATVGHALAAAAGLATLGTGVALRTRGPGVERFEAVNPEVREALRTARDVVERSPPPGSSAGSTGSSARSTGETGEVTDADTDADAGSGAGRADTPVARALHETVLERLRETSSRDLVPWRRLAAALVLVAAVSGATIALSAGAADVRTDGGPADGPGAGGPAPDGDGTPSGELEPGDEVLGEETDVDAGTENRSAEVGAGPGGRGDRTEEYDRSGLSGDGGDVDARRAGYAEPEPVEEADLIREYTLALDEEGGTDAAGEQSAETADEEDG